MTPGGDLTPLTAVEQGLTEEEASPPAAATSRRRLASKISAVLAVAAILAYIGTTTEGCKMGPIDMGPLPEPYKLTKNGTCSGDAFTKGGINCFAPWVYCTDAKCESEPHARDGVLVATCQCWMPTETELGTKKLAKESIIPKETSGAACVANAINPGSESWGVTGGEAMCEEMKKGALISTYGALGTKPPASAVKCAPRTKWAWCWGAPCRKEKGQIFCDCPIMISDYDTDQYVSVQTAVCAKEENLEEEPCDLIHNGSPAGGAPMSKLPQCER